MRGGTFAMVEIDIWMYTVVLFIGDLALGGMSAPPFSLNGQTAAHLHSLWRSLAFLGVLTRRHLKLVLSTPFAFPLLRVHYDIADGKLTYCVSV